MGMTEVKAETEKIWKQRPEWPFLLFLLFVAVSYVGLVLLMLGANVLTVSWAELGRVLKDSAIQDSIRLTVVSCTATAILSVFVAVPLGYLLSRYQFRGRAFLDSLVDVPVLLPPLVVGLSLLILFNRVSLSEGCGVLAFGFFVAAGFAFFGTVGRRRIIPFTLALLGVLMAAGVIMLGGEASRLEEVLGGVGLPMTFHPLGVVLAQFPVAAAFAIRTMKTSYDQVSPRYEEVAMSLGCQRGQAFKMVVLPQVGRGVVAAGTMAWARALGEFGPILIFAGATRGRTEVLSTSVFLEINLGNLAGAAALSLVMIFMAVLILLLVRGFLSKGGSE